MGQMGVGALFGSVVVATCMFVSCGGDDASIADAGAGGANAGDVHQPGTNDAGAGDAGCAAPRVSCNGVCVDTMTNVNNCGICGHACGCGSTSCTAGVCDPAVVADKQGAPYVLTLSDGYLYWGADADRALSRASVGGGDAAVLFPGRTAIRGIAVSGSTLFFTRFIFNVIESGTITGGGGGNWTNTREGGAYGVAVDDKSVYWADDGDGTIRTALLTAPRSPSSMITGQTRPANLVIDANYIFWITNVADTGTVMRMSKTGGSATATPLASNQATPSGLAIDGHDVYWTNDGDGTVNQVPIAGGTITPIATGRKSPRSVAVDGNFVYWTELGAGTVEKAPLSGAPPTPLAINQPGPLGLAIDASCVYFTAYANGAAGTGSIRKASK